MFLLVHASQQTIWAQHASYTSNKIQASHIIFRFFTQIMQRFLGQLRIMQNLFTTLAH